MDGTAHDFAFESIDGGDLNMSDYAGKAVLVVNTASYCGYTKQYDGLQALWDARQDEGLVVLGVPSNDFGAQEPGSEEEISSFCSTKFSVDFPMTAKQTVIGGEAHPFYRWVVAEAGEGAAPKWNIHKYLVGPDGALAGAFPSKVEPMSAQLKGEIEALLD